MITIRLTDVRGCAFCVKGTGQRAIIYEIFDDVSLPVKQQYICRNHLAQIVRTFTPFIEADQVDRGEQVVEKRLGRDMTESTDWNVE